jgi:alpha-2-macroglobulin
VSGHANRQTLEQLYEHRDGLSSYGLAILGLAFETVNDQRAAAIASQLVKNVRENASEASWPANRDEMLDFSAAVTPETTAYVTKILSHEQPDSPLLPKAALWLVNHRNEGFWWSSTKQTAMVIYGLIDYVKATKELNPDLKASIRINGEAVGSAQFGSDNLAGTDSIVVDESKLRSGNNEVEIQSSGTGRLYYSVSGDYYSNEPKAQNQGTIALNVLRDYYKLVPEKSGGEIVYDLQPLNGPVAQGDVLAVRLTVTGSEWRYLLAEDPIPAGTEFVKDDNLYHLRNRPPWWQYWFTERENHDNRVAIFDSWFNHEQRQYFYVLKVVNPGLFHVSPARVQPMYQPEYQATTGATTLEVK